MIDLSPVGQYELGAENRALAEGRAQAVWSYLASYHVDGPSLARFENAEIRTPRPIQTYEAVEAIQRQLAARFRPLDEGGRAVLGVEVRVVVLSLTPLSWPRSG